MELPDHSHTDGEARKQAGEMLLQWMIEDMDDDLDLRLRKARADALVRLKREKHTPYPQKTQPSR